VKCRIEDIEKIVCKIKGLSEAKKQKVMVLVGYGPEPTLPSSGTEVNHQRVTRIGPLQVCHCLLWGEKEQKFFSTLLFFL
jgi:hypothetical protein